MLVMRWSLLIGAMVLSLMPLPSMGRDLDGRYANSPLKPWFDQLKSRNGASAVRLPTATSKTTGEQ